MTLLLDVFAVLFGAVLGSFLNALIFRYGTDKSVLRGRSACMQCNHVLSARDLIPVFSYLLLRGKCRYCGAPISMQYPLVELASAFLSLLFFLRFGLSPAFLYTLVISLALLFIVVYDLRHMLLPTQALWVLGVLSILPLVLLCNASCHLILPGWAIAAGPVLAAPLLLISLVSRGRAMGWGDGFLELSLGWLLGFGMGISALFIAFWSGALVGIGLTLLSKRYTMKSEVPFAPFLILGATAAFFLHADFFAYFHL